MTKNTYVVNQTPKLIDLNGEYTNFRANFDIKAKNTDDEFECIIASQKELDESTLNFEKSKEGNLYGNIEIKDNFKQSYFIVLKSEEEIEVEVNFDVMELPLVEVNVPPPQKASNNKLLKIIVAFGGIVIIVGVMLFFSRKKKKVHLQTPQLPMFPRFNNAKSPSISSSGSSSHASPPPPPVQLTNRRNFK